MGFDCSGFRVACPNVLLDAPGFFGTAPPLAPPRGLVVFFTGTSGSEYWTGSGVLTLPFMTSLRLDGFEVVQVRWTDGWLTAARGETPGPALLACRPATAVQWIHENLSPTLRAGAEAGPGQCGFCLTGQSGGADQAFYSLSFYGLEGIIDAVLPTSGPTHSAMVQGCLQDDGFTYGRSNAQLVDDSYGFVDDLEGAGPCVNHVPAFSATWNRDGLDTGADDSVFETTRVHFIIGGMDPGEAPEHAEAYDEWLVASGSPHVTLQIVPGMQHTIYNSEDGLNALREALLGPV